MKYYFFNLHDFILMAIAMLLTVTFSYTAHAGDYYKGKTIYATYCQNCHGSNGQGDLTGTPNFTRGLSMMKPDARLFDTIYHGHSAMPAYQGVLKNEDIYNVISYIRNFY